MGNQARQSQELELWEVVHSSGNRNSYSRQARARRQNMQNQRDDRTQTIDIIPQRRIQNGNTNRARTVRQATARASYDNVEMVRRNVVQADIERARTASKYTARTRQPQFKYQEPSRSRTSSQKTKNKTKKARHRARLNQCFVFLWITAMCAAIAFMGKTYYQNVHNSTAIIMRTAEEQSLPEEVLVAEETEKKPDIQEDFLTISDYNRPGTKLAEVNNIFVHYTANKGTSAAQNRSYFENLGVTHERAVSAHFIIGYEGEIIQCIPLEEEAYAVIGRNKDSISIECCFTAADGSFTQETYDSLVEMLAWLIDKYNLKPQDILRHYDCGGKKCPIYYVDHEDAWQKLLYDVEHYVL
ncbi:MAG: peptidoglycan recognition protein family protein [Lachnospiraceae bacterium]|jgi:N-acetylmuramoyl-L-alanine amidase